MENIQEFIEQKREELRELNLRIVWLQKHNFQEEVMVLHIKYGAKRAFLDDLISFAER